MAGEAGQIHFVYFFHGKSSPALFFHPTRFQRLVFNTSERLLDIFAELKGLLPHTVRSTQRSVVSPGLYIYLKTADNVPVRRGQTNKKPISLSLRGAQQQRNNRLALRKSLIVAVNCRHCQLWLLGAQTRSGRGQASKKKKKKGRRYFCVCKLCWRIQQKWQRFESIAENWLPLCGQIAFATCIFNPQINAHTQPLPIISSLFYFTKALVFT